MYKSCMRQLKATRLNQSGFGFLFHLLIVIVILALAAIAYLVSGHQESNNQNTKLISSAIEKQAETSQYPKTPIALVQKVYGLGAAVEGPYGAQTQASEDEMYGTGLSNPAYFTPSEYANLKSSPQDSYMPFCVDGDPYLSIIPVPTSSNGNSATVTVYETPQYALPSPDPSTFDITLTLTLHPLLISNVVCPDIPVKTAG
jgi:hypothetical protein